MRFVSLISDESFHTIPFKISFSMAWRTWLSHCIIFRIRKRNNELTDYQICCLLFGCFFLTIQKQCCPLANDRTFSRTCRLRGQYQGLENVSLRPRTSSRTPPLDLTVMRFEPLTSRSRDERVTNRPIRRSRKKTYNDHNT